MTGRASPSSPATGRSPAGVGSSPSCGGPRRPWTGPSASCRSLPLRGKQAEWSARLDDKREQAESAIGYVRALRRLRRVRGRLRRREPPRPLGRPRRRRPRRPSTSTPAPSTGRPTCRTSTCRRSSPRPGCGPRAAGAPPRTGRPACGSRCSPPTATWPPSTSRTRSSPPTSWRPTRGWPRRRLPPTDRARFVAQMLREGPSLLALDQRDRSDFLRHFYRRYENAPVDQIDADAWQMFSDLILTKSFPAGIRRVREHRALGHRTVLITGALDFVVEPLRPALRRHRLRLPRAEGRPLHGRHAGRAPDRRGPGPGDGRLRQGRGPVAWPSPWPTPTPPRTCRCSTPSASPSPSTPRPACRPWPASGAGWWSTSTSPPAAPARPCPSPPAPAARRAGSAAASNA